jgi:hypothetical protein
MSNAQQLPPDTTLLIKLGDAQKLMDYLVTKPGGEVFKLIPLLVNLPFGQPVITATNGGVVDEALTSTGNNSEEVANGAALTQ